jgi:16S rRNA (uracil1498-N3)-methyltransferase
MAMKTRRFFVEPEEIRGHRARLSPEESHHLRDVLRLGPGEDVELFDGQGAVYHSRVALTHPLVELEIIETLVSQAESPLKLILGQALIKGDKFSWVIQKCTELGMAELVPLATRYSESGLRRQAIHQPDPRWKKIALSSAAQCRRASAPIVHPALELPDFCGRLSGWGQSSTLLPGMESRMQPALKLVVSEKGGLPARALSGFETPNCLLLVVGPEGGWADDEIALFKDSGFMELHLGNRILRSETAAVAAVTLAQFLWGDLGNPKQEIA